MEAEVGNRVVVRISEKDLLELKGSSKSELEFLLRCKLRSLGIDTSRPLTRTMDPLTGDLIFIQSREAH